jgi:HrpA-like RNA helicase
MPTETLNRPPQETLEKPGHTIKEGLDRAVGHFRSEGVPMTKRIPDIHSAMRTHDTIIIEGQTGSGKSTVAPLVILESVLERNKDGVVAMTQPRRGTAKKIADTFEEHLGGHFAGYRYKGDNTIQEQTRLQILMERSLINDVMRDPKLDKYDAVILDEIHERSVDLDILMPLLKEAQRQRANSGRPLKIILASATMETDKFLKYFGNAKLIQVEGRMFDLDILYENKTVSVEDSPDAAAQKLADLIRSGEKGNFQIFLHGIAAIKRSMATFQKLMPDHNMHLAMHLGGEGGNLEAIERAKTEPTALWTTPAGETGFTVTDLFNVIDTGYMNVNENIAGVNMLNTRETTQGNSDQRGGRTGRVGKGKVHRLYRKEDQERRKQYIEPQIHNTDISLQVLQLLNAGMKNLHEFDFVDHPGNEKINQAMAKLTALGAIDDSQMITEVGKRMIESEADLTHTRMLIEADNRKCLKDTAVIVGILTHDRSIYDPDHKGHSFKEKYKDFYVEGDDLRTLIKVWNAYVKNRDNNRWGINYGIKTSELEDAVKKTREMLKGFGERIPDAEIDESDENIRNIYASVFSGMQYNLVEQAGKGYKTYVGELPVQIDKNSALSETPPSLFLAGKFKFNKKLGSIFAEYNLPVPEDFNSQTIRRNEKPIQENIETEVITETEATEHAHEEVFTPIESPAIPRAYGSTHQEASHQRDQEDRRNIFQKIGYKIKSFIDSLLRKLGIRR